MATVTNSVSLSAAKNRYFTYQSATLLLMHQLLNSSTERTNHLWNRCCCSEKISGLTCKEPRPSTVLPAGSWSKIPVWIRQLGQPQCTGNKIQGKLWARLLLTFSLTRMLLPLLHKKYLPGKIQRHRSLMELCPNMPSFSVLPKQSSLAKNTVLYIGLTSRPAITLSNFCWYNWKVSFWQLH